MRQFIRSYLAELKRTVNSLDVGKIELATRMLTEAYRKGRKVFIIGNGGSASLSSHMACDLGKGTLARVYDKSEKRLRVMSLTDNVSLLTAFANDLSFSDIFIQQLRNLIEKEDLVIVLSGSGNSLNVVKAVRYAKGQGAKTIGFLGFRTGGKLAKLVDCAIVAQSNHYGPIEDTHLILNHILTSWLAKVEMGRESPNRSLNKSLPFKDGNR